jgi:hypothetical protein
MAAGRRDEVVLGGCEAGNGAMDPARAFAPLIGTPENAGQYWSIGICTKRGVIDVDFYGDRPIDIVVLDRENFGIFAEGGQFVFDTQSSRLNVDRIHYSLEASEIFYFVLSNVGGIEGGADPQGPVNFHIRMRGASGGPSVDSDTSDTLTYCP